MEVQCPGYDCGHVMDIGCDFNKYDGITTDCSKCGLKLHITREFTYKVWVMTEEEYAKHMDAD